MTAYYPSQAGYATTQPVVYNSSMGYGQPYGVAGSYVQPAGGVMYVPSYGSRRSRSRYRRNGYNDFYSVPQVATVGAPVVMQPAYSGYGGHHHHHHHHHSFGARMRRFFGLAPSTGVRYRSDHGTWGFMGYSRHRQRYVDPRTGAEVDRQGRLVYRV